MLKLERPEEKMFSGMIAAHGKKVHLPKPRTVESRYNAIVGVQKTGPRYKWIAL